MSFILKNFNSIGGEAKAELSVREFCYKVPENDKIDDVLKHNYFLEVINLLVVNDIIRLLFKGNDKYLTIRINSILNNKIDSNLINNEIEANEENFGVVKIASQEDVDTGTNNTKAITPKYLKEVQNQVNDLKEEKLDKNFTSNYKNGFILNDVNYILNLDGKVKIEQDYINPETLEQSNKTKIIENASEERDGLMPQESFNQIITNTQDIAILKGANKREPTEEALPKTLTSEEVNTIWLAEVGREATDGDTLISFNKKSNNEAWSYFNSDKTWHYRGIDTVLQASNNNLGVVKGDSSTSGKVFVENDGSMSVNDWDKIIGPDEYDELIENINEKIDIDGSNASFSDLSVIAKENINNAIKQNSYTFIKDISKGEEILEDGMVVLSGNYGTHTSLSLIINGISVFVYGISGTGAGISMNFSKDVRKGDIVTFTGNVKSCKFYQ